MSYNGSQKARPLKTTLGAIALLNFVCDGFLALYGTKKL